MVLVGERLIVEMGSHCKIWGGEGWVVFKTCPRCSWLWVVEKY